MTNDELRVLARAFGGPCEGLPDCPEGAHQWRVMQRSWGPAGFERLEILTTITACSRCGKPQRNTERWRKRKGGGWEDMPKPPWADLLGS